MRPTCERHERENAREGGRELGNQDRAIRGGESTEEYRREYIDAKG